MRSQVVLFILFSLLTYGSFSQTVFKVSNFESSHLYYYVSNPIVLSYCSSDYDSVSVDVRFGVLDSANNTLYWVPQDAGSFLTITKYISGISNIDTLFPGLSVVDVNDFTLEFSPVKYHYGVPDISNFKRLGVKLPFKKYGHLDIDSMIRVDSYDVNVYNNSGGIIEKLHFSRNSSIQDQVSFMERIRDIDVEGSIINIENVYIGCRCWSIDNSWTSTAYNTSVWLIDGVINYKSPF